MKYRRTLLVEALKAGFCDFLALIAYILDVATCKLLLMHIKKCFTLIFTNSALLNISQTMLNCFSGIIKVFHIVESSKKSLVSLFVLYSAEPACIKFFFFYNFVLLAHKSCQMICI